MHEILFIQQSRHANEREVSELPISIAIGDVTITKSLEDAVNALNTSSLVAAMGRLTRPLTLAQEARQALVQAVALPLPHQH